MNEAPTIVEIAPTTVKVDSGCDFIVIKFAGSNGQVGWGEATLRGQDEAVLTEIALLGKRLLGEPIDVAEKIALGADTWKNGYPSAVVAHSFVMAILDLRARTLQVPAFSLIGSRQRDSVDCYANVNKGSFDRTTSGWAERAASAHDAGFSAIKIAPFDNVSRKQSNRMNKYGLAEGLDIVHSVRDRIGPDCGLMVDCHWRFSAGEAAALISRLEGADIEWLEGIIPETPAQLESWCRLKSVANSAGIKLAGGEYQRGLDNLMPVMQANAFDVVNPDVRFVGIRDMLVVASTADALGIEFSPHNPLGPVMDAASLSICLVAPAVHSLEVQYENITNEWPKVVSRPAVVDNGYRVYSDRPGLGVDMVLSG